jgi:hypothetical protein
LGLADATTDEYVFTIILAFPYEVYPENLSGSLVLDYALDCSLDNDDSKMALEIGQRHVFTQETF